MPGKPHYFKPKAKPRQRDSSRLSAHRRGYDGTWRRLRLMKLADSPICEHCEAKGKTEAATEVDHIVPINDGGERLDPANLQALCKPCHSRKTIEDMRTRGGTDTTQSRGG